MGQVWDNVLQLPHPDVKVFHLLLSTLNFLHTHHISEVKLEDRVKRHNARSKAKQAEAKTSKSESPPEVAAADEEYPAAAWSKVRLNVLRVTCNGCLSTSAVFSTPQPDANLRSFFQALWLCNCPDFLIRASLAL